VEETRGSNTDTPTFTHFKKVKKKPTLTNLCNGRRIFPRGNKSAMERKWRKTTTDGRWHRRRSHHSADDHVPVLWSL